MKDENPYQSMGQVGAPREELEALFCADFPPIEKVFVFFDGNTATITGKAILVTSDGGDEVKTLENMDDNEILGLLKAAGIIAEKLRIMGYEVKE